MIACEIARAAERLAMEIDRAGVLGLGSTHAARTWLRTFAADLLAMAARYGAVAPAVAVGVERPRETLLRLAVADIEGAIAEWQHVAPVNVGGLARWREVGDELREALRLVEAARARMVRVSRAAGGPASSAVEVERRAPAVSTRAPGIRGQCSVCFAVVECSVREGIVKAALHEPPAGPSAAARLCEGSLREVR